MAFSTDVRELQALLDACSSTREREIFYLALKTGYINKTHTYTKWSRKLSFQFCLTITKPFSPLYLEEIKVDYYCYYYYYYEMKNYLSLVQFHAPLVR